jgi:hypothetical protein
VSRILTQPRTPRRLSASIWVVRAASLAAPCSPVATRTPTIPSYRDDPLYPRIAHAVEALLKSGNVVAPVDVLIEMRLLTREQLEDWRLCRMPYLERIINCNLARLGRLLRILRFHAHDLNLKPSWTAYMRWGEGPKQRLRFSKSGDPKVEEAYATHFVWPGKRPFHRPRRWSSRSDASGRGQRAHDHRHLDDARDRS